MDGVIVGSDLTQEWALPWWWERYRAHNNYPVAFIDLGLSLQMKDWCRQRGQLILLKVVDFTEKVDPKLARGWEAFSGTQFWESRGAWFKKPFACLKSPFERTLWIDTDCEIRGSIKPLFSYASRPLGLAVVRDPFDLFKPYPTYNSGVLSFRTANPLLQEWADSCLELHPHFQGDQDVLAFFLSKKGIQADEIPPYL